MPAGTPEEETVTVASLFDLLVLDEGYLHVPYAGPLHGTPTVGIGHNITAHGLPLWLAYEIGMSYEAWLAAKPEDLAAFVTAHPLSDSQIDRLYQADLEGILPVLEPFGRAGPVRYAALADMAFNLGGQGFMSFTTFLGFVKAGEWSQAARDLRGTLVYRQLTTRYERLAAMLESNTWPVIP